MIGAILETALRFVPLHAEAAEHRRECTCDVCEHHLVAAEPHPWCVLCGSADDIHREPRAQVYLGRAYPLRRVAPWASLCQTCWCHTRVA